VINNIADPDVPDPLRSRPVDSVADTGDAFTPETVQGCPFPPSDLTTHVNASEIFQELRALNGPFDEPWCTRLNSETWGHWRDQADGFYE
jgi:hypothetical protein